MPWNPRISPHVRTVHLGEFSAPHAGLLGQRFDAAGIAWWTKEPGFLTGIWQLGVEVFVDRTKLEEARAIADALLEPDG